MASFRITVRPFLAALTPVPRAYRPAAICARTFSTGFARWAVVKDGPPVTQTNRKYGILLSNKLSDWPTGAEQTLRRFWKTVNISATPSDGYLITLDHRALKTPFGAKLEIPKERRLLAALIANEWENQDEVLKQHALPVVCARSSLGRVVLSFRPDFVSIPSNRRSLGRTHSSCRNRCPLEISRDRHHSLPPRRASSSRPFTKGTLGPSV